MSCVGLCRELNPRWNGGRTIRSNGYVWVKVPPGHHLANSQGYAYEHRVVAEEKIGRSLEANEIVHHINGDKTDNRPENLEVTPSRAHHHFRHRRNTGRRAPGEDNPIVECSCGCGEEFGLYDECGRPRMFVSGHNPQPRYPKKLTEDNVALIRRLSATTSNRLLAEMFGVSRSAISDVVAERTWADQ